MHVLDTNTKKNSVTERTLIYCMLFQLGISTGRIYDEIFRFYEISDLLNNAAAHC